MNNREERQDWIYEELLKDSSLKNGVCFTKCLQKFTISRQTFQKDWNVAFDRVCDYRKRANEAKDNVRIAEEVESVRMGLKPKIDRQLYLQQMIEDIDLILKSGITQDVLIANNEPCPPHDRPITIAERGILYRTIQSLNAELSKMGGDYAPAKADVTTNGRSLGSWDNLKIDTFLNE